MKMLFVLLVAAIGFIPGCSQIREGDLYSSGVMPDIKSVKAAGGEQLYKDTLFLESDFSGGVARTLSQYDFTTESAPCTVLGARYRGGRLGEAEQIYSYPFSGNNLQFACRPLPSSGTAGVRRLVLLGSSYECRSQSGLSSYINQHARENSIRCNGYRRNPKAPTVIDLIYKEGSGATSWLGLPKNFG